jgi:DNA-binding IclR family transcriptional regulator
MEEQLQAAPTSDALTPRDPYLVKSVVHASAILSAFHMEGEELSLKQVVARCNLPKSMVFRLLYTMERCAFVEKVGKNLYRLTSRQLERAS